MKNNFVFVFKRKVRSREAFLKETFHPIWKTLNKYLFEKLLSIYEEALLILTNTIKFGYNEQNFHTQAVR